MDIDAVRSIARGRWREILCHLANIPAEILDGDHHPCPRCGGNDRFRMIDEQAGALLCNQCFNRRNGDGFAALQWATGCTFLDAIRRVADYLGVDAGKSTRKSSNPAANLEFLPWDDLAVAYWTLKKQPITPVAVRAAHGRLAKYRGRYHVVALPIWGPELDQADPVGWVLHNTTGRELPKFRRNKKPEWVKVKITHGSDAGLIGQVDRIPAAREIWKVEGTTDLLAALSLPDLPDGVAVITNANGAQQNPFPWLRRALEDKTVYVLHDADDPGEMGAEKWCEMISYGAARCYHVRLPYDRQPTHGKDLRHWTAE